MPVTLPTEAEFVLQCQLKYESETIPEGMRWEKVSLSDNEELTLWSCDKTLHTLIQAVSNNELITNRQTFINDMNNLIFYYPQFLELYTKQVKNDSPKEIKKVRWWVNKKGETVRSLDKPKGNWKQGRKWTSNN